MTTQELVKMVEKMEAERKEMKAALLAIKETQKQIIRIQSNV